MLIRTHYIISTMVVFAGIGCISEDIKERSVVSSNDSDTFEGRRLPNAYFLIDELRNSELNTAPFNHAIDGKESEARFTDEFAAEIGETKKRFSTFFSKHGEYGSLERYNEKLPSDWWISDDFYSTSRVLAVDILNPKLQVYAIVEGVRQELQKLDEDWMILMSHDNDYDALGDFVGRPGSYSIWIRADRVEIFPERPEDIEIFMNSLPNDGG